MTGDGDPKADNPRSKSDSETKRLLIFNARLSVVALSVNPSICQSVNLVLPLIDRGILRCGVRPKILRRVRACPEIGWTFAVRYLVARRLQTALEIRSDCPEFIVGHVTPGRPRHRDREIIRLHREVSF